MKTFKDLQFKDHPNGEGKQARIFFPNGYGVSVVRFKMHNGYYSSYTNNENEWEVAVLKGNEINSSLCYSTEITDDVLGHLTESDVSKVMENVQKLASCK